MIDSNFYLIWIKWWNSTAKLEKIIAPPKRFFEKILKNSIDSGNRLCTSMIIIKLWPNLYVRIICENLSDRNLLQPRNVTLKYILWTERPPLTSTAVDTQLSCWYGDKLLFLLLCGLSQAFSCDHNKRAQGKLHRRAFSSIISYALVANLKFRSFVKIFQWRA